MQIDIAHQCTKAQAIAAALSAGSAGGSKAYAPYQQTLLGSAVMPMQPLLTHPRVSVRAMESATSCFDHEPVSGVIGLSPRIGSRIAPMQDTAWLIICTSLALVGDQGRASSIDGKDGGSPSACFACEKECRGQIWGLLSLQPDSPHKLIDCASKTGFC